MLRPNPSIETVLNFMAETAFHSTISSMLVVRISDH
jgi:hypothetical protein